MARRIVYNCDICGAEYQLHNRGETARKICKFEDKDVYLSTEVIKNVNNTMYSKQLDLCSNCCKALKATINTLMENNYSCDITVDMEED